MAKKTDPFDKFREATLNGGALSGAIGGGGKGGSARPLASAAAGARVSKNADRKMVSFHIPSDVFYKLGLLKFEMGVKYDDLYNEAIRDLLTKYGKA